MRFALLFFAVACLGLVAGADGVSRKAVSSPGLDRLTVTGSSAWSEPVSPGHEVYRYRHGATYRIDAGSTAYACEAACGDDAVCQAWSFVQEYGSAGARCELKRGGGKSEENLLATSGVSPRVTASYWGEASVAAASDTLSGNGEPAPEVVGN